MKKAFSILLTLSFLVQCSAYVIIYANFEANRDYIAKNLCENRNRPDMKCNGKCQLCKRLKAEDKKENKGLPATKNLKQNTLFSYSSISSHALPPEKTISTSSFYEAGISRLYTQGVFHPPLG